MRLNREIFRTYDIRGLANTEITSELAEEIGKAFVALLAREIPHKPLTIAVGRDMRESSPAFQQALVAGMISCGANVVDIGLVSTPAFYFGVGHVKADGGVMVSASHNPARYNGFKLTRANAVPVSGDTGIKTIADLIEAGRAGEAMEAGRAGVLTSVSGIPALAAEAEIAFVHKTPLKRLKIVADAANGMGAQYMDALFSRVDADLIRMYWEFDGSFPNHEADPLKDENVRALKAKVKEVKADLGIATDGDGDRVFFVDNEGETVPPAIVRGLLAQITLRSFPGATICYDIRPGRITQDMIVEAGGKPAVTRVGHSLIKEQMRATNAVFGGESSGHFFYAMPAGTFEAPVAAILQMLEELTRTNKTLADLVRPYKRYAHSGELNFHVKDKETALKNLKMRYPDGTLETIDGITITYPTFWFNVRASNTESVLRLNLEAVDEKTMVKQRDEIAHLLQTV